LSRPCQEHPSVRLRVASALRRLGSAYDRVILTPAFFAFMMFLVGGLLAWLIVVKENPYMGANYITAAVVSCPIFGIGVTLAVWHLLSFSRRSVPAWIAFALNLIPFGFTALVFAELIYESWNR
jgi:hypothetical protein